MLIFSYPLTKTFFIYNFYCSRGLFAVFCADHTKEVPGDTFSTGTCGCHFGSEPWWAGGAALRARALCTLQPGPGVNIPRRPEEKKNDKAHMEMLECSFLQTFNSCKGITSIDIFDVGGRSRQLSLSRDTERIFEN